MVTDKQTLYFSRSVSRQRSSFPVPPCTDLEPQSAPMGRPSTCCIQHCASKCMAGPKPRLSACAVKCANRRRVHLPAKAAPSSCSTGRVLLDNVDLLRRRGCYIMLLLLLHQAQQYWSFPYTINLGKKHVETLQESTLYTPVTMLIVGCRFCSLRLCSGPPPPPSPPLSRHML